MLPGKVPPLHLAMASEVFELRNFYLVLHDFFVAFKQAFALMPWQDVCLVPQKVGKLL